MAKRLDLPAQVPNLKTLASVSAARISASKFSRDGEVVWRQPQNRIVLPLSGLHGRPVTVQFDGGRTKEFLWHGQLGFYPAGAETRTVAGISTSLHLLWTPDAETAGLLEPLNPFEDDLISMWATAIASELDSEAPDRLFVESLGNAAILRLKRIFSDKAGATPRSSGMSRERLRRVTEYIDAHLGDDLTLDVLADIACLSAHHLSRSFHRTVGVRLHRYVLQRRIERAKQLILETELSMAEIGWMVGFGSQAAFTKRFHQEVGQSPARLRRGA